MHGPRRDSTSLRKSQASLVDLGNEPALRVGDRFDQTPIGRAVSLRWLTGTVLTGFTSIFLMGGALMAALDGRHQLAVPPQAMTDAERAALDQELALQRKGDRVRHNQVEEVATREVIQVSTLTRQGDHDLIKLRPFARIAASLVARKDELSDAIPEFDPIKIFNAGTIEEQPPSEAAVSDQIYGADVDGEITIKSVPFPLDIERMDRTAAFTVAEVEEIVRFEAGLIDLAGPRFAALGSAEGGYGVEYTESGEEFSGVRIIPENVTFVSKTDPNSSVASLQEKIATVRADDDIDSILDRYNVGGDDRTEVIASLSRLVDLQSLAAGQKIRLAFVPFDTDGGSTLRPVRVSIYEDGAHQATVARTDDKGFVRADEPSALPEIAVAAAEEEPTDGGQVPRVYEAVYQTALSQEVPEPVINELIKVLSYEIDFQARVNYGDSISLLHSLPVGPDEAASGEPGEILYASIALGGTERRFYRYRTPDDGVVDYYDADGRSAKKFLMRKPMSEGAFRSGFGMRRHPILGRTRMHTGVDWAAARGTPIMAAGDGVVQKATRTSGYGNFTLIKHTNGYVTAYAHQNRFAKGLAPGVRVRQGQIIGYVGTTGLSTGPHLHYEVRVNGKYVDPLRIRLPRGRILTDDILAGFERERRRIDELLGNEPDSENQQFASAS